MVEEDKRSLIDRYLAAYCTFDVDGMIATLHPEIVFENVSGGETNVMTRGIAEFRALAEQSAKRFATRKQTIRSFRTTGDEAFVDVSFEGELAADLPNGMKAGETLRLDGRSEFSFYEGKISRIKDVS